MNATQYRLQNAASGLMMMSESDYPFEYFTTQADTIDEHLARLLAGKPDDTPVEKTTLDFLLRNLTDPASGSVSPADAQKFKQLVDTLKQELNDLVVYRVGNVQVDVFIIGRTAEGEVAGMKTKLIET